MARKRAVITGITGQDGAYLSQFLLGKDYEVIGITRDTSSPDISRLRRLNIESKVTLIRLDLLDQAGIIRMLQQTHPDEIYNLAAQSSVARSYEQPTATIYFNVLSTTFLLEGIRLLGLHSKFYQASSSEMFGKVQDLPITEATALHPLSPYAISKAAAHWTTVNYREAYGLFSCCGILFNHESVLRPVSFVTKKIIRAALEIKYGLRSQLFLGDMSVKRDWGYAPEYVKCMWLILQHDVPDDFIIATGESHTLSRFVDLAFQNVGLDSQKYVEVDPALIRPLDIENIYGDATKAREQLGWRYDLSFQDFVCQLINEEREFFTS